MDDQTTPSTDFAVRSLGDYYGLVWSQLWRDLAPHMRAHLFAIAGGAVAVFVLAYLGINSGQQNLPRIEAAAAWSVFVLPLYLLVFAIRSPWKIDNTVRREHDEQSKRIEGNHQKVVNSITTSHSEIRSQLQAVETSLGVQIQNLQQELQTERDQNAEPDIIIRFKAGHFKTTVEHPGSAYDGGEPVYTRTVCVSLLISFTNTRPRQVTVDSYKLVVYLSDGNVLRSDGCFAGDPLDSRALGEQRKGFPGAKRLERDLPLSNGLSETRIATFFVDVEVGKDDDFEDTSAFIVTVTDSIGTGHTQRRDAARWNSFSSSPGLFLEA